MKKNRNRYRGQRSVKILEQALSIRDRLFSMLAVRRGTNHLKKIFLIILCILPFLYLIGWGVQYTIEKAYSLSIEHISYESRLNIFSKQHIADYLGIKGSINMATLDASGMQKKLEEHPCIASAHIRAELPDTLSIEIEERIPIVYVELTEATQTGQRKRFFMDPHGVIFPVLPELHRNFLEVPVWYLHPADVNEFHEGAVIPEHALRPIVQLITAVNSYNLTQIPHIQEIFHTKGWKLSLTLEGGINVTMQVHDIPNQITRLAMIIEHAQATGQKLSSINVIPAINPTAVFIQSQTNTPEEDEDDDDKKRNKRSSRRRR